MRRYPLFILLIPLIVAIYLSGHLRHQGPLRHQGEALIKTESTSIISLARIADYPIERPKTWRYRVTLLPTDSTSCSGKEAYVYLLKDSLRTFPTLGDTIWMQARWQTADHPSPYAIVSRWQLRGAANAHNLSLIEHARRIRQRLIQRYRDLGISGDELATLSALTLGYRDTLNRDIRDHFRRSGAAHILAVSGLHTGILYVILFSILTLGGLYQPLLHQNVQRWALHLSLILILWAYAFLTGMSASVVRSVTMFTILNIGLLLRRQAFSINTLAAAAIILLLFRPEDLYNVGFWLSFSAVAALILLAPHVKGYFSGLVVASIAAQLGTLPITLYCFGQISHYFLLTNLFIIPLVTGVFYLAIALLTFGFVPGLGTLLAWLTTLLLRIIHWIVAFIATLPFATTTMHCTLPMMLLLYAAIITGALAIRRSLYWLILTATALTLFCILYTFA